MITSSYPRHSGDGAGSFVASLAQTLVAEQHQVSVIAPWDAEVAPVEQHGVEVHRFRYAPADSWHVAGHGRSLKADRRMRWIAPLLMPGFALAAAHLATTLHKQTPFDVIHGHWAVPGAPIAAWVAERTRCPLVLSLHGSDVYVIEHSHLYAATAKYAFQRAYAVMACSNDLRQRAIGVGLEPAKSQVIPYGVDASRFGRGDGSALRERLGIPPEAPVIGAMGRLVYKKGFEHLIAALPALLQEHLGLFCVIGGEGDLHDALAKQIAALGLSGRCLLPGNIGWDETPNFYAMCDTLVVPSVIDRDGNVDGLPNVLLEGLASGCATVASRVAGIPDTITDGKTGLLIAPEQPAEIAQACSRLLGNPDLRAELGQAARAQMLAEYTWQAIARRHLAIYEDAIHAQ